MQTHRTSLIALTVLIIAALLPATANAKNKKKPHKPQPKVMFAASSETTPVKLKKRGWICGYLHTRDNDMDGVVSYHFTWSIPGMRHRTEKATWNGEEIVAEDEIPLIARLAQYGSSYHLAYVTEPNVSYHTRELCTVNSKSMRAKGTGTPKFPKRYQLEFARDTENNSRNAKQQASDYALITTPWDQIAHDAATASAFYTCHKMHNC